MELQRYFPFWDKLTQTQRAKLEAAAQPRQVKRGEQIFDGAEDCLGLVVVVSGQLRVYTLSEEGKELTLYRLFQRDICLFSASCILPSIQFDVLVTAQTDAELLVISSGVYRQLMEEAAPVANYTNAVMASHFSEVMWLMDQLQNRKLDARLAAFLLEEAELTGSSLLEITHEQIASHMGTMREVISRLLKYLENEGLVELSRGKVRLLQGEKLEELARPARK